MFHQRCIPMVYFLFVVAISLISLPSQSIETSEVEVEVAVGTVNDVPVSHRSSFHNDLTEAADFVNYYETYSFISEQKRMLSDDVRMDAYHRAIIDNADCFAGKVVLDVGAGSGILSIWAAKAGARKVYAVEYTSMAKHARMLMKHNKLDSVVEVIQSSVEDLVLPEKVDVIISEWMGMVLLRESMLDSLIRARDKFLKPGGTLWPSEARLHVALLTSDAGLKDAEEEFEEAVASWSSFENKLLSRYGADISPIKDSFIQENTDYYRHTAQWRIIEPKEVFGKPQTVYHIDISNVTQERVLGFNDSFFEVALPLMELYQKRDGTVSILKEDDVVQVTAVALWFSVDFAAGKIKSVLSTGPEKGYTHWGQYVCYMPASFNINANKGVLGGAVSMVRIPHNPRMYNIRIKIFEDMKHQSESILPSSSTGAERRKAIPLVDNVYNVP